MNHQERTSAAEQLLRRRLENVYPNRDAFISRIASEEKLTFYLGIDPTGSELHLGHTIPLLVLRDLAKLGHQIILLIGDFTARIGDPTGKSSARVALSTEEVEANMNSYVQQVEKILEPGTFRVVYNSEWLSRLTMSEVIRLTSHVTVQQMIQRDMFQERLTAEKPIYLNEFLYPLLQGYDSVALQTDGEVGGNDQTFNMLMGRELERAILGKEKLVLATRLLVNGASGKKMSKTEGSIISVNDSAQEIRRKVLSFDDSMIRELFLLCTDISEGEISNWQREGEPPAQPREAKEALAAALIRTYQGEGAVGEAAAPISSEAADTLVQFLKENGVSNSSTTAKALIDQGAVMVNGVVEKGWNVEIKSGDEIHVGKGKRFHVK